MAEVSFPTRSSSNLLALPKKLISGYVFPNLRRNDLLRLRRTCKQIKLISDDYIRSHQRIDREIEINESDCTFDHFLSMGFPFHRVFLNNFSDNFFEHPKIPQFLEQYASEITHLRVETFNACIPKVQDTFYLALTQLRHLEMDYIDTFDENNFGEDKEVAHPAGYFPVTFKNLKTLKLGDLSDQEPYIGGVNQVNFVTNFFKFCTELEYIRHPMVSDLMDVYPREPDLDDMDSPFEGVIDILKERLTANPDALLKLKYYDINFVRNDKITGFSFADFAYFCKCNNIKLLNVYGPMCDQICHVFDEDYEEFAEPIVSVNNVHACMFLANYPILEKVVISTRSSSFEVTYEDEGRETAEWPKLEVLDVTIDSDYTGDTQNTVPEKTVDLLDFLFVKMSRPTLKDLRVRFNEDYLQFDRNRFRNRTITLPCPRAADIVENCKNLTKLTLTNWLGINKAVLKFWKGLPLLEEVTLEKCKLLGNVAFVGTEKNDPIFLKLKKLKKLTLAGLEEMPKITDLIFVLVFRHLHIKQFYLTSRTPVKSVTAKGIRSLQSGDFNMCVEKFPFTGWSLDNTSEEEFNQLKSEFRASHML